MSSSRKILRQIVRDTTLPSNFLDYKNFLSSLFLQAKNNFQNSYSYSKFAGDLGFSSTNIMYQYISGQRKLSMKAAQQISQYLELKGDERKYFNLLVEYSHEALAANRDLLFEKIVALKEKSLDESHDKDMLTYLKEWYHPVVRELVGYDDFQEDPNWIVDRITPRIRPEQARKSLDLLKRIGLITFDTNKQRLVQTRETITTGHRIKNIAVTSYHIAMLDRAKDTLIDGKPAYQNLSAMTISIDEERFNQIKSAIHEFNEKILHLSDEVNERDRIYQLNIQFFPFTSIKEKNS